MPARSREIPLLGGSLTSPVRVGDFVRRRVGPWAPAVHAVLRHLEAVGFDGAPRVIDLNDKDELLTFIEGRPGVRPRPPALLEDHGLANLGRLLCRYHEAVSDFVPAPESVWRVGKVPFERGYVICHGDLVPGNTIWRDDRPVALIDWDFAEPGLPVTDVAQLAWTAVPLRSDDQWLEEGFPSRPDLRHRLAVLCDAYGRFEPGEVLDALLELHQLLSERMRRFAAAGMEPWMMLLDRGDLKAGEAQRLWLKRNRGLLTGDA